MKLQVNNEIHHIEIDEQKPLLWVLRDELGLMGTKYGCGIAQCGACTVHVDGEAVRSCILPVGSVTGKVTTIEGVSSAEDSLHVIQEAWLEQQVTQCGYCQSGQIMSAIALLNENDSPTDEEIDKAMSKNLCRCGTYSRIKAAIHTAAKRSK